MIFVGMSSRTSGLIRGVQLADRFGWKFYEAGDRRVLNERNETIIFIRSIDTQLANSLRSLGNKVGFDLLDRPVADQHAILETNAEIDWHRYSYDIDFYIVNNEFTKSSLKSRGNIAIPIHVIPHHTVNFENRRCQFKDRVTKVGYVGLENQFMHRDEIEKFLKSSDIKFVSCHPMSRHEVSEFITTLDIGLISVEGNPNNLWKQYILDYKPNVKLTNFQSFGLPVIAGPYRSFEEFGKDCWIKAAAKEEFVCELQNLINDKEKRYNLSRISSVVGDSFHIDRVKEFYEQL